MAYSPFQHLASFFWKRRPIQLTYFVTRKCNSRCPFCFYLSRPDLEGDPELTIPEVQKISSSLGKLLWLAFSGGEIFLRRDLVDLTEVFYKNNQPAIILLPTNGLLTQTIRVSTEAILKRCPQSTVVVKLSLDGPDEIHDVLRGTPGAFRQTIATYEALADLLKGFPNFELGINTVFCAANQNRMPEVIDLVKNLKGIKTHTISLIRGEVGDNSLKEIDLELYGAAAKRLARELEQTTNIYRFKGAKLKAAQDILQRRFILETVRQGRRLLPCYAGVLNLVLTESGMLYPCESFKLKFGNLREVDYDIKSLLRTDQAKQVRSFIKKKGCFCTHECYFMTNILFNPRMYPALLREYKRIN